MNSPAEDQLSEHVQAALREAARVAPLTAHEKARLRARLLDARPQPRTGRLVLAFSVSLVAGVMVTWLTLHRSGPPASSQVTLVAGASIEAASPQARTELVAPDRLRLVAGSITVTNSTAPTLTLLTPMFDVVLQRNTTAVASTESAELVIREGSALVTRDRRQVALQGPATITSSDSRLQQPPPPPAPVARSLLKFAPPADPSCGRACALEASQGTDVSAQLALTRLAFQALQRGAADEAEQLAQSGLTRFPGGVLAPENHLVLMQALAALGKSEAAQREGRWFLEHAPTAPAAPGVALFLGDLALAHDAEGALRLYQAALQHGPSVDDTVDALEAIGLCEVDLGHLAQARAHFQQALDTLPSGPRAAALRARLENVSE